MFKPVTKTSQNKHQLENEEDGLQFISKQKETLTLSRRTNSCPWKLALLFLLRPMSGGWLPDLIEP
jgi:hypothetical protein